MVEATEKLSWFDVSVVTANGKDQTPEMIPTMSTDEESAMEVVKRQFPEGRIVSIIAKKRNQR